MSSRLHSKAMVMIILSGCLLAGCLPSGHSQLDEEKEPHYLAGKSRVSGMDYRGAIESFSKAVEVNPRSGAAHLELGWLYDQKEGDPAAAIYHYSKYLQLRPQAENGDTIKTRILACKQELARTVSLGPVTQAMQKEFEQLALTNKRLSEDVEKWKTLAESLQSFTNRSVTAQGTRAASEVRVVEAAPQPSVRGPSNIESRVQGTTSRPLGGRVHAVKAGETPTAIARRYGVKVDVLMRANPQIDPRRMKVGDTLKIP